MHINTTIVISNYNYGRYVGSAIESCLDQTVQCKIIVVDDLSLDNSWEIIRKYAKSEKNVIAVRLRENSRGNARGKNVGICMSDTEFITCLDSDDMLVPWSIECRLKSIKDNDFIHGWAKLMWSELDYKSLIDEKLNVLCLPVEKSKRVHKIETEQNEVRWTSVIEASTVLSRKKKYEELGLYDEEMRWKIDREMWWRWLSHGVKRTSIYSYVSIYRNHKNQVTRNRKIKNPKKCTEELIKRKKTRLEINRHTTLLMDHYMHEEHISEIVN